MFASSPFSSPLPMSPSTNTASRRNSAGNVSERATTRRAASTTLGKRSRELEDDVQIFRPKFVVTCAICSHTTERMALGADEGLQPSAAPHERMLAEMTTKNREYITEMPIFAATSPAAAVDRSHDDLAFHPVESTFFAHPSCFMKAVRHALTSQLPLTRGSLVVGWRTLVFFGNLVFGRDTRRRAEWMRRCLLYRTVEEMERNAAAMRAVTLHASPSAAAFHVDVTHSVP